MAISAPKTAAPRQIQIEYARLFNELQQKLNLRLYQSPDLTDAINAYNKAITSGVVTTSSDIFRAFDRVVSASTAAVQEYDAKIMVNEIFPQLETYNESSWKRRLRGNIPDLMLARVMDSTRVAASEELAKRMTENVDRISTWTRDHYQNFQNELNNAIRKAENTGVPFNLFEIAQEQIKAGKVPPLNRKTRSRAYTIARDQTSKFNAALTRTRANSIGSEYYLWQDSKDGRVRPTHQSSPAGWGGKYFDRAGNQVDKNGVIIPGGLSTGGIQPADEVNCRCSALWQLNL